MENRPDSGADDQLLPPDDEFVTALPADSDPNLKPGERARPGAENEVSGKVLPVATLVNQGNPDISTSPRFLAPGFPQIENDIPGRFEPGFQHVTPLDPNGPEESLRRETAVAGAVTAVFLGVWSIIFSYFTGLAVINAMLGIVFAIWGLFSTRSTLAIVGLVLCCAGFVMTMVFVAQ